LDDSTSAVDTKTDSLIRQGLATSLKETTKIIIGQRISSIQDADRIIVMKQGKVIDEGAPKDVFMNVDTLKGLGLDVPVPSEIAVRLQEQGVTMPTGITTNEELGGAICQFN